MSSRKVVCADAFEWLACHVGLGPVITSPPDAAEVDMPLPVWAMWFRRAVRWSTLAAGEHPAVFYVTDRRADGRTYSKAGAVLDVAQRVDRRVLWHKVALRRAVGTTDLYRPTFSHLIAVGGPKCRPGVASPDVFERGPVLYPNGMGVHAAEVAVNYVRALALVRGTFPPVVNPFCGRGTVLAAANARDLDAIGIDNDPEQCAASEEAVLP